VCIDDEAKAPYIREVQVRVNTFDCVLADAAIASEAIELIKVDVEGHEQHTVKGMAEYLSRPDAAPLWCEVRGPASNRGGNTCQAVTRLLAQWGYQPFVADGGTLRAFTATETPLPRVFDLLFLVPHRHAYLYT
jgi:hypothetical protein